MLTYFMVSSLSARVPIVWPSAVAGLLKAQSSASAEVFSLDCSIPDGGGSKAYDKTLGALLAFFGTALGIPPVFVMPYQALTARKMKLTMMEWKFLRWCGKDLREATIALFRRQPEESIDSFPGWRLTHRMLKEADGSLVKPSAGDLLKADDPADTGGAAVDNLVAEFGPSFAGHLDRLSQVLGRKVEPRPMPSPAELIAYYTKMMGANRPGVAAIATPSDTDETDELELSDSSGAGSTLAAKLARKSRRADGAGPSGSSGGPSGSSGSSRLARGSSERGKERARSPSPTAPRSPGARGGVGRRSSAEALTMRKGKSPADGDGVKAGGPAAARARRRSSWNPFAAFLTRSKAVEKTQEAAAAAGRKSGKSADGGGAQVRPVKSGSRSSASLRGKPTVEEDESTDEDTRDKLRLAALRSSVCAIPKEPEAGWQLVPGEAGKRTARRSSPPSAPKSVVIVPLTTTKDDLKFEAAMDKVCEGFQYTEVDLNNERFVEYYIVVRSPESEARAMSAHALGDASWWWDRRIYPLLNSPPPFPPPHRLSLSPSLRSSSSALSSSSGPTVRPASSSSSAAWKSTRRRPSRTSTATGS